MEPHGNLSVSRNNPAETSQPAGCGKMQGRCDAFGHKACPSEVLQGSFCAQNSSTMPFLVPQISLETHHFLAAFELEHGTELKNRYSTPSLCRLLFIEF